MPRSGARRGRLGTSPWMNCATVVARRARERGADDRERIRRTRRVVLKSAGYNGKRSRKERERAADERMIDGTTAGGGRYKTDRCRSTIRPGTPVLR
ncbi:hypothetical protein B005_3063 [Nocardiopsis alba ATCC BAA-2165]|uniref:Uncharacterized protein n=1 Tax=Nocardiopsis alba (strain ATCC BAA-2165 / BE74) TaxID=1205910 RepID=J7LGU3_NOCAA|nr:hypothetical protein B005_3063 [Nocardiopsis alba ATCC BAA-2165]